LPGGSRGLGDVYKRQEGSRTPVQTKLPLVFYMFIVLLFVGNQQEKHKPIDYLAV
jgi:hypothetical protein